MKYRLHGRTHKPVNRQSLCKLSTNSPSLCPHGATGPHSPSGGASLYVCVCLCMLIKLPLCVLNNNAKEHTRTRRHGVTSIASNYKKTTVTSTKTTYNTQTPHSHTCTYTIVITTIHGTSVRQLETHFSPDFCCQLRFHVLALATWGHI